MTKLGTKKVAQVDPLPQFVRTPQRRAPALTQHGQWIFTAVWVMDGGASHPLLPAHNRQAGSGGGNVCVAVEEGSVGAGNFVPSQELLSLSLGHTWFHQSARPSFIIDANQFRAD